MNICPSCGHDPEPTVPGNAEREIVLRVPERHFALFRKTLHDMEVKLGMYGLGELANQLKPYGALFDERRDLMRYFDDGAIAMCMTGITWGYDSKVRIEPAKSRVVTGEDRVSVSVDFAFPGEKVKSIQVAEVATPEAAEWFSGYFEDAAQRLRPLPADPAGHEPA